MKKLLSLLSLCMFLNCAAELQDTKQECQKLRDKYYAAELKWRKLNDKWLIATFNRYDFSAEDSKELDKAIIVYREAKENLCRQ